MQNLCFRPECTISGHQSCEASILLHWTENDVQECFTFGTEKDAKLVYHA
jgi:hypothetical protein